MFSVSAGTVGTVFAKVHLCFQPVFFGFSPEFTWNSKIRFRLDYLYSEHFASCLVGATSQSVASSAFSGFRVDRYPSDPDNPDRATAQTLELMCRMIDRAASDPVLVAAARDAVQRFRGGPLYAMSGRNPFESPAAIAESIWWWAKHALRFVHHDGLIRVWFNERDQLQLLIGPDLLLRMNEWKGDCAIYTMLICAMLRALGVRFEIVTVAANPHEPDIFGHVYPRALLPAGGRLALDASHGSYPGWKVPPEHTLRMQVWDESGNPIPDSAPRFKGLHGYQAYPQYPILPARLTLLPRVRRRGGRGLGQIDLGYTAPIPDTTGAIGYTPTDVIGYAPGSVPPSGFNLGSTIGNLLTAWTQIGTKVIAPTTSITSGPGGTQIVTPAGTSVPSGAVVTSGLAATSGWFVIALGVGLLVIIGIARSNR